ncbi:hypothetical protein CR513_02566, partial [Mucuna pruriens]
MVTPFASVFLNHYTIRVGKKVGWISLAPLPNTSLFTTYTTSYKGFKNHFLKITALDGASFCSDYQPLPLYWKLPVRDQVIPKSRLPMEEKATLQFLDELPRGMNCRELVALVGEDDPQKYMRSVLKKKSLDIDALILKAKQVPQRKDISTPEKTIGAEKESTPFLTETNLANPVAEKKSTSSLSASKMLVSSRVEMGSVPLATEKMWVSLPGEEESAQPDAPTKRKADAPTVEDALGKKGKGAMSLPLGPGQPKGQVVVALGSKLPLGGLSCYATPSGTKSLWGPEMNIQGMFPPHFIPQHDRGLLVAAGANNTLDMLETYHIRSLASLEVWRGLLKRFEQIVAKEVVNKREFEKMAKAHSDMKAENERMKIEVAKLKADREGLWADLAASKSKATAAEAELLKWKTQAANAKEEVKSLKDKYAESPKWKAKANIYEGEVAKLKT